jgi:hypothetical protein
MELQIFPLNIVHCWFGIEHFSYEVKSLIRTETHNVNPDNYRDNVQFTSDAKYQYRKVILSIHYFHHFSANKKAIPTGMAFFEIIFFYL